LLGYTVEGRLGGFILPFDIGLKFGYLPIESKKIDIDYLLVGGDVRFAVLKGNVILPKISVGMGYNFMKGGLTKTIGNARSFGFEMGGISQILNLSAPEVGFLWETSCLDFKAQISKSFIVITPYLGIGLNHAWSKAGYDVSAKLTDGSGNPLDVDAKNAIKALGITNIDDNGFSSIIEDNGWSGRLFGGFSVNLTVIKLDLTAMYNFADSNYGATFGVRFQL
jgi:hypothetical protein